MKVSKQKFKQVHTSSGHQVLALGLFIMLLAFFIVLNALSTFDEKTARPVMASLERTFAPRIYRQDVGQAQVEAITKSYQEGTSLERISGIFTSRIPGITVERQREGVLSVRVKTSDLMDAINKMATVTEFDKDKYLAYRDIFVAVLSSQKTEQPLRMDVIINKAKSPSDADKGTDNLTTNDIEEVSKMAAILQAQGLPINLYSFSYVQGEKNKTDITFEVYEPYNFGEAIGAP